MRRFWWAPLAVAAVLDLLLVVHAHFVPGAQVDRAVRRSLLAAGCQEAVLVRTAGGPDDLSVLHVTVGGAQVSVLDMRAEFGPSGGLTAASRQNVAAGSDSSVSVGPVGSSASAHPLLDAYAHQLRSGANWLNGACLPLPNPRASRLRAAGNLQVDGAAYHLFRGHAPFQENGQPIFQSPASVWMGVSGNGTLGFAVVEGKLRQTGVDAVFASMFGYNVSTAATILPPPGGGTGAQAAGRMQYYLAVHADIEDLLIGLGVQTSSPPPASGTGAGATPPGGSIA